MQHVYCYFHNSPGRVINFEAKIKILEIVEFASQYPFIMFSGDNGFSFPERAFEESYRCYPVSFIEKPQLENGDKVILPDSALKYLALTRVDYPMLFEIYNAATERRSHCGVIEFTAEEGMLYMPYWMMQNMLLQEGDIVRVKTATLPKGTYVKFQLHTKDFLEISDPKAVLEKTLRNFSCLTTGDSFMMSYNNKYYYIDVIETKPSSAISIIDTDCEAEFVAPLDCKQSARGSSTLSSSEEAKEEVRSQFTPFSGVGRRMDGKIVQSPGVPINSSISTKSAPQVTNRNASGPRSAPSSATKHPSRNIVFASDTKNDPEKASMKNITGDEIMKEPPRFQPFTGRRYSLKG